MKIILKIYFLLSFTIHLFSQESKTFLVVDEHKDPIPFAHVHFKNTMNGTISNVNGEFRITAPNLLIDPTLVISSIGYMTKEISFNNYSSNIITLPEDIVRLNEVVVVPKDYERELLNKAIEAIPNNYPAREERHKGFARESAFWQDSSNNPIYVAESTLETIKDSYETKNSKGHVKVSEGRRYIDQEQKDKLPTVIVAGSHHINRFDAVGFRSSLLSNDKDFELEISDTLRLYNENLYKLSFKKGEDVNGYLLIIDSSFAIVEAYFDYKGSFPLRYRDASRRFMNYKVSYERSEDNKWRYKHSKYNTAFKYGKILNLKSEFVSTRTEPNEEKIPYLERIHRSDVFLDNVGEYDSSFWKGYTIIIPNEGIEKLFRKADLPESVSTVDSTEISKPDNNKAIRSHFEISYIPIDVSQAGVSFSNDALDFSSNENATSDYSINFVWGLDLEIRENFWVGIRTNTTFRDRQYSSLDFVVTRDFNLNPNGRPILISPKLIIGHQWVNHSIGSVEHESNYKINGKKFDSGKTNLYLHERGFHLSPTISLGLEKNQVVKYFLSFGTNVFLKRSTGVVFNEDDQFFLTKKNEFLIEGGENLDLNYDGDLLSVNWMVSFGIYLGRS
ncbi:carboxypeptidase-like regulatory domain-containing protein [Ekhidna sp.]